MRQYAAYGLVFQSADRIRDAMPYAGWAGDEAVQFSLGEVPTRLSGPCSSGNLIQINETECLFDLPDVLRAWAVGGRSLRLEFAQGGENRRGWYSALAMGAAMIGIQRGHFPLHGSAVAARRSAAAFVGASGAGKSTLVAALVRAGYPLLSDDLCLIRRDGDAYRVGSGVPAVRLLPDAALRLDMEGAATDDVKIAVPLAIGLDGVPLTRIYHLRFAEACEDPEIRKLSNVEALGLIAQGMRLTVRLDELPPSWRGRNFDLVSGLVRRLKIFEFSRPRDYACFDRTMALLVEHLEDLRHDR